MFSAKKIKGKKLYELARQNIEIELKSVEVEIYNIEVCTSHLISYIFFHFQ